MRDICGEEQQGFLYIGTANHGQLRTQLRADHSLRSGGAGRHSGGRYIWQLADAMDCFVAWRVLPLGEIFRDVEKAMTADFLADFGKRPFANLVA